MSYTGKAVFLSYASQDAEAVRVLAEALRTAGVEVWFDQNELVGGDVWDAKIRQQIKACALFVPIVSATTQARLEGYFRVEWKLAAQRTHAMATAKAFLLPVVIDDTRDAEAHVPEEFFSVQWTRLRPASRDYGGQAREEASVAAFCARVANLVGGEVAKPRSSAPRDGEAGGTPVPRDPAPRRSRTLASLAAIAAAVAVVALLAWASWSYLRPTKVAPSTEKTLAVLPFATAVTDPEVEKLSDGIADELLTQLGRAPGLRVSGRTSSFSFKGQKLTDAEIARKLDVQFLVAGTFEKIGSQVRIRPQLINAANGSILWGETFTKELTNVFALQDEIAGLIAQKLQTKLGFAARSKRSVDPVAYGLVQKGRYLWLKRSDDALAEAVASYEAAIKLDPEYAEAYAGLADAALVRGWYLNLEGGGDRWYRTAREAAQRALAIDATLAEPHAALGGLNMNEGRFADAEREFQTAIQLNPNYSYAHHWRAHLLAAQGRIDLAIESMQRATQIDPFSLSTLVIHAVMLAHAGRHEEAVQLSDRAIAVRQNEFLPADGVRALSLLRIGRREDAVSAARLITKDVTAKPRWWLDASAIHVLRQTGHEDEAKAHAARLLAARPGNDYFRIYVAAALGQVDEALDVLARSPVPPTTRSVVYHSEVWEPVRQSPRFRSVMTQLGWWDDYEQSRVTMARLQQESTGKK